MTAIELLVALQEAVKSPQIPALLGALEDLHGYKWLPVGQKEANYGLINIGSDPGLAFVERITNAIDALIELEAQKATPAIVASLQSPRDAVQKLFGIKDGRLIQMSEEQREDLAKRISVQIRDGATSDRPTIEIRDFGVGVSPANLVGTILSLADSNKISKRYLAGAYGQGGSTTFAFCGIGTTIISRDSDHHVAVTFVRYNDLDPNSNKNGRYEYLADTNMSIASIPATLLPFKRGVLIRHFDYELRGYTQRMTQLQKSLWSLSHTALFDSVLPFTLVEARTRYLNANGRPDRRTIRGNYARLQDDKRDKVEYSQTITITISGEREYGRVVVHYWLIRDDSDSDAASYVNPVNPIVITNFGQTHGYVDRRFIVEDLKLPFVKNHLIVQVELDYMSPAAKRELLSSTRDRLKRGELYERLVENVAEGLRDDEMLDSINRSRRDRLVSKHNAADQEKMKRRFAELMEKFRPGNDAPRAAAAQGEGTTRPISSNLSTPLPALETGLKPTYLKIGNKIRPIEIRDGRQSILTLESDAPDGYLSQNAGARLSVLCDPAQGLEVVRHTDFVGGRARMAIRRVNAAIGSKGNISAFLLDIDERTYNDVAQFIVKPAVEAEGATGGGRGLIQTPDIEEIYEDRWGKFNWSSASVVEVDMSSDQTTIFVNMDNQHLKKLLTSANYQEQGLNRMKSGFLLYAAFFGYLRETQNIGRFTNIASADLDEYKHLEEDRLAQTVISSLASMERVDSQAFA